MHRAFSLEGRASRAAGQGPALSWAAVHALIHRIEQLPACHQQAFHHMRAQHRFAAFAFPAMMGGVQYLHDGAQPGELAADGCGAVLVEHGHRPCITALLIRRKGAVAVAKQAHDAVAGGVHAVLAVQDALQPPDEIRRKVVHGIAYQGMQAGAGRGGRNHR